MNQHIPRAVRAPDSVPDLRDVIGPSQPVIKCGVRSAKFQAVDAFSAAIVTLHLEKSVEQMRRVLAATDQLIIAIRDEAKWRGFADNEMARRAAELLSDCLEQVRRESDQHAWGRVVAPLEQRLSILSYLERNDLVGLAAELRDRGARSNAQEQSR